MNPRDEKILIVINRKQKADYSNLVPFRVIKKSFPWIDSAELTSDLVKLSENGYLWKVPEPSSPISGWWYGLTPLGNREYERINYDSTEKRKSRNIQFISSVISAVLGTVLGYILKSILG